MTDYYLLSQTQSGWSTRQKGHCMFVCACEGESKERKKNIQILLRFSLCWEVADKAGTGYSKQGTKVMYYISSGNKDG